MKIRLQFMYKVGDTREDVQLRREFGKIRTPFLVTKAAEVI